jgi:hypothetical protein
MTPAAIYRFLGDFARDERGMSRMDCAVVQVPVIILAAVGTQTYTNNAAEEGAEDAVAATVLGLPADYVIYGALAFWAAVLVVRVVIDLRE